MEKFSGPASEPWNMKEDAKETLVVPNVEQENSSGIEQLKAENDKLKMALLAAIQDPNDSRGFTYEHLTSEKLDQLA